MNNKLFREVLQFLNENDTGESVVINHLLKAGSYKPGDIASTLGYMVDCGYIGGCLYKDFNKNNPITRKRNTVDDVEIKTRILPAGAKYYNDNFKKEAKDGSTHIHAENSQINYTNLEGAIAKTITVKQVAGSEEKTPSLEKWSWILGIVGGLIAIITFLITCEAL